MTDIFQNIDELNVLLHRKIELLGELKRALRIAELVGRSPKDMGKVTIRVSRNAWSHDPRPWQKATFSVRVGDDPWEDFALSQVHKDLWPEDLLQVYNRWQARLGAAPKKQGEVP